MIKVPSMSQPGSPGAAEQPHLGAGTVVGSLAALAPLGRVVFPGGFRSAVGGCVLVTGGGKSTMHWLLGPQLEFPGQQNGVAASQKFG